MDFRMLWWVLPAAVIAAGLLLRRYVLMLVYVKGSSMRRTLEDGDWLLALRYNKKRRPQRMDVVICRYPKRKEFFVKRIIALPGETVSMQNDIVYINGEPLKEDTPRRECMRPMKERTLGEGEYFVLGDNRPNSKDSRTVGALAGDMLIAKAVWALKRLDRKTAL